MICVEAVEGRRGRLRPLRLGGLARRQGAHRLRHALQEVLEGPPGLARDAGRGPWRPAPSCGSA
eukprot:6441422-Lingulodinium_polyedra.AAC.1